MDSSQLFNILGNENRRRIIELLAQKPCYVTEISEYIGVSPKAVIDHLQMLEDAGIIECRVDERRRKYFYIARNLRLEVSISPYTFGVKSAYPKPNFNANYEHIDINHDYDSESESNPGNLPELVSRLEELEKIENELSLAQRYIQSRVTQVMEKIEDRIEDSSQNQLQAQVLATLIRSKSVSLSNMARETGVRPEVLRENLRALEKMNVVEREEDEKWKVKA